jgi:hypothetical protein
MGRGNSAWRWLGFLALPRGDGLSMILQSDASEGWFPLHPVRALLLYREQITGAVMTGLGAESGVRRAALLVAAFGSDASGTDCLAMVRSL